MNDLNPVGGAATAAEPDDGVEAPTLGPPPRPVT